jgi:hypothetical protein
MSDQLIGGPKPIAGGDSLSQTGTMRTLTPEGAEGKTGAARGKALPPATETGAADVVSISVGRELRFIVDLEGSRPVIHVLDRETGELIRRIPVESISDYSSAGNAASLRLLDTLA